MHICQSQSGIWAHAPAKVNLFLEVLDKRADGFHEIESLMCPIDLYDTLFFTDETDGNVTLECNFSVGASACSGDERETFPTGPDNLIVQAIDLLRKACGVTRGMRVRLVKRIPAASGLAGGSSDAAAALVAANRYWGLGLSQIELAERAAELGSDVPFFLFKGAAVARGRGEKLEPVGSIGPLNLVVVRPPEGLSTAEVYRGCRPSERPRAVEPLVAALERGASQRVGELLYNHLTEAAAARSPWIGRLQEVFAGQDVLGHEMSGSGTSYFGICRTARHARRIAARLQGSGVGQVYAVRTSR